MKVSGGLTEQGVVVGNTFDKYGSPNPLVRRIMAGFDSALEKLVELAEPTSIHEVGCGEGFWIIQWNECGLHARGSDFSDRVIELARSNASEREQPPDAFKVRSIYDLGPEEDTADLVVCCEVLEHLEQPELALKTLKRVTGRYLILSVPREPLWCAMNLARAKYISRLGNTPGHIQHWSKRGFIRLVSKCFDVLEVKSPLPWTMLLCKPRD